MILSTPPKVVGSCNPCADSLVITNTQNLLMTRKLGADTPIVGEMIVFGSKARDDKKPRHVEETRERLRKLFRGAFDGPPTPLKEIPKRGGKSGPKPKSSGASRANAKNERP